MANVIESWSALGTNRAPIARLGKTEEVFSGSECMRPRIAGIELDMLRVALADANQHAIVGRGAGVFIGADSGELRVRPRAEEEEARVSRIGQDRWSVLITLTEEPEAKLSDILHSAF